MFMLGLFLAYLAFLATPDPLGAKMATVYMKSQIQFYVDSM